MMSVSIDSFLFYFVTHRKSREVLFGFLTLPFIVRPNYPITNIQTVTTVQGQKHEFTSPIQWAKSPKTVEGVRFC